MPLTQREASEAVAHSSAVPVVPHCYFPLDHLNVFVFPRFGEMPLWKRKEAKEKGLSELDSLWS